MQEITASKIFNYSGGQGWLAYTKFAFMAKVEAKHTYAVLINRSDCRGLLGFAVDAFAPVREVRIMYAVKDYQVHSGTVRSPCFGWSTAQDRQQGTPVIAYALRPARRPVPHRSTNPCQRLFEIGQQIAPVFNARREAHQAVGHARFG